MLFMTDTGRKQTGKRKMNKEWWSFCHKLTSHFFIQFPRQGLRISSAYPLVRKISSLLYWLCFPMCLVCLAVLPHRWDKVQVSNRGVWEPPSWSSSPFQPSPLPLLHMSREAGPLAAHVALVPEAERTPHSRLSPLGSFLGHLLKEGFWR